MPFGAITQPGGGGGGVTAPTLESGLTLAEGSPTLEFDLVNNDPSNPAAVDLSFSSNYMQAASPHNGSVDSPSYVIEAGQTLPISLERGSGAPLTGSQSCTVTALLADGETATQSASVEAASVSAYLATVSAPTYELKFAGNLSNTGSGSSSVTSGNITATAANSAGLTGEATPDTNLGYVQLAATGSEYTWSVNRSMVWIYRVDVALPNGPYVFSLKAGSSANLEYLHTSGGRMRAKVDGAYAYLDSADSDCYASTANTGGVTDLTVGTGLKLVIAWYDAGASHMRVRYKQAGDGVGHSYYYDWSAPPNSTSVTNTYNYVTGYGRSGYGASSTDVDYLYYALVDHEITDSEFDNIASMIGL